MSDMKHEWDIGSCREDLRLARIRLDSLLRAPHEGRWTGDQIQHEDAVSAAQARVRRLHAELDALEGET